MPKRASNVRGYDSLFVERVRAADASLLGVQLGLLCVEHAIPVEWIATRMKVSRQAVYDWFTGVPPRSEKRAQIERLMSQLRKRLQ